MSGIKTYVQTDLRVPPTENTHVVRLGDLIDYVAGMTKQAVRVVMTAPLIGTYNTANKTLTQTTPAVLSADGVTLVQGDRVLLAGQLDLTQNGIYTLTTPGVAGTTAAVLTRAVDFNSTAEIINGMIVPVAEGGDNAGTRWKLTVGSIPFELDATNLIFEREVVDFTKIVEMAFDIAGDGATTSYPFTHSLGTLNVTHEIFEKVTWETVVAQFRRISTNTVQVDFGVPLSVGENMTLVIRAEVDPS